MRTFIAGAAVVCGTLGLFAGNPALRGTTPAGRVVTVEAVSDNILKVTNILPGETVPESKVTVRPEGVPTAALDSAGDLRVLTTAGGL
ncbi:MAG: hypothetical protein NC301_09550, partial [Bacteroides sp.]|nr:hypothetical protein [Bacteroides sp.]